jgi:large subunit ribosomal protein L21
MKYAVFSNNGKQYKVSEGEELLMDHLDTPSQDSGRAVDFADVLLVVDGDKVTVGEPTVKGAKVSVDVMGDEKGEKLRVVKYKAKSRYRRTNGFRHQYTRVKVNKIAL